jgi:TDG/mug DNA glycosylase family protein
MTNRDPLHQAFAMVADTRTRLLVLGSLPGRQSLAAQCYYANSCNQFWQLMTPVVGCDLVPLAYPQRLAAMLAAGIGLWDVAAAARRRGSLDSAMRDVAVRDLAAAIAGLPALRALAFNGGTASRIGQRQFGGAAPVALIALPSSSSAHAIGIAAKRAAWLGLADYLGNLGQPDT